MAAKSSVAILAAKRKRPFGVCLNAVEDDQASRGSGTQDVDEWMAQAHGALEVHVAISWSRMLAVSQMCGDSRRANLLCECGLAAPGFTHKDAYARRREFVSLWKFGRLDLGS